MWKGCEAPLLINQLHYIDFESLGYARGLEQLTARLEDVLGGKQVPRFHITSFPGRWLKLFRPSV